MDRLELSVKGSVVGHNWIAPAGTKGLVWALNTTPAFGLGHLLWRPRCSFGKEGDDYARIFDPSGYHYLYADCVQNSLMVLIGSNDGDHAKVVRWKPGSAPVEFSYQFPYPDRKIGMLKMVGKDCVVAIEGHGLFVMEYDEEQDDFVRVFKIGAGLVSFAGGGTGRVLEAANGGGVVCSVNGGLPAFVGTVRLFVAESEGSDFKFKVKLGDVESEEEYDSGMLTKRAGGFDVWTPLEFTFNQVVTPPFDVEVVITSGNGTLYVESASKWKANHEWEVVWAGEPCHIHIGGTLCPDGGVVGATRGQVIGKYGSIFVELGDIATWTFEDEFGVDNDVTAIEAVGQSLVIGTDGGIYVASGWTHGGVEVVKIYDHYIDSPRHMKALATGVVGYSIGKPIYIGQGGVVEQPFPFLTEPPGELYLSYLGRWACAMLSWEGSPYVCVWFFREKNAVWWRFDELRDDESGEVPIPMGACQDCVVFSNGYAYYLGWGFSPEWKGYEVEVVVGSGMLGTGKTVALKRVDVDCGWKVGSDDYIHVLSSYGGKVYSTFFRYNGDVGDMSGQTEGVIQLPNWLTLGGEGIWALSPDEVNKLRAYAHGVMVFGEADVLPADEEGDVEVSLYPVGNSFLVGLHLGEDTFKHPGMFMKSFVLYFEEVGEGLWAGY